MKEYNYLSMEYEFNSERSIIPLKITKRQFNKILKDIKNASNIDLFEILKIFILSKEQCIQLMNTSTDMSTFLPILSYLKGSGILDNKFLKTIFINFNRIKNSSFNNINEINEIASYLSNLFYSLLKIYNFKLTEEQLLYICTLSKEIFPTKIYKIFISIILNNYRPNEEYSERIIKEYIDYFSAEMLVKYYSEYINNETINNEILSVIKTNINNYIFTAFGRNFPKNAIKIDIYLDLDALSLYKQLNIEYDKDTVDMDKRTEFNEMTIINFYKQGENNG